MMLSPMPRLPRLRAKTPDVDELIPPERAMPAYTRRGDFKKAGTWFRQGAVDAGLKPDHRVLDLGCGVGRLAVALSEYLDQRGRYVGFDTDRKAIRACKKRIGSKLPHFSFVWADVFNTHYNRDGEARAAQYRFPFDDDAFDFVFSNSLFTHLVPEDARNYFHEIGRVLKPGGRTMNTMFLLNEVSLPLVASGEGRQGVLHSFGDLAWVKKPEDPAAWIAVDEDYVRKAHDEAGLQIQGVRHGAWSGREASWSGREESGPDFGRKDIVVAQKLSS
jgi:ubiquinone/menaquinone biosynthesis C-methylase UbiE